MNLFGAIQRAARRRPGAVAIETKELTVSYGNLMSLVAQIAAALHERGVQRGDVVGIHTGNIVRHISVTLAVARLGAVSVPLTQQYGERTVLEIAQACSVKFIVHDGPGVPFERASLSGQFAFAELDADAHDAPPVADVAETDTWRIALTSGTTGRPKPVRLSHQAQIVKSILLRTLVPVAPGERMLVGTGVAVTFGANYWLRTLLAGCTIVGGYVTPAAALEAIARHEVTLLLAAPGHALAIAALARRGGGEATRTLPSLEAVVLGGSVVKPAQQEILRKHLAPQLYINYGAAEVGVVAFSDASTQDADPQCAGAVPAWIEVQALADDGNVLPPGVFGSLRMRGAGMSDGYVLPPGDPAHSAFRDGWFHSSDTGYVSAGGLVYLHGRRGEVINLSGLKVDPMQVEAVLERDAAVIDCAVFVTEPDRGMPQLAAALVLSGTVTREALQRACTDELGASRTPRSFYKVGQLPRNEAGKLLRGELVACARQGQAI